MKGPGFRALPSESHALCTVSWCRGWSLRILLGEDVSAEITPTLKGRGVARGSRRLWPKFLNSAKYQEKRKQGLGGEKEEEGSERKEAKREEGGRVRARTMVSHGISRPCGPPFPMSVSLFQQPDFHFSWPQHASWGNSRKFHHSHLPPLPYCEGSDSGAGQAWYTSVLPFPSKCHYQEKGTCC